MAIMKNRGEKKNRSNVKTCFFYVYSVYILDLLGLSIGYMYDQKKSTGFSNFEACNKNVFTLADYFFSR